MIVGKNRNGKPKPSTGRGSLHASGRDNRVCHGRGTTLTWSRNPLNKAPPPPRPRAHGVRCPVFMTVFRLGRLGISLGVHRSQAWVSSHLTTNS